MKLNLKKPLIFFDLETTGISVTRDRIVQLGYIKVMPNGSEEQGNFFINPEMHIPEEASAIHHITDEMVRGAPRFASVGREFLQFAEGSTLVAHNARFDLGFLQESLARCGLPLWKGKTLDSVRLARRCFPGLASYRLQSLRAVLRLDDEEGNDQAHRAGADVFWTAQVLRRALERALRAGETARRGGAPE